MSDSPFLLVPNAPDHDRTRDPSPVQVVFVGNRVLEARESGPLSSIAGREGHELSQVDDLGVRPNAVGRRRVHQDRYHVLLRLLFSKEARGAVEVFSAVPHGQDRPGEWAAGEPTDRTLDSLSVVTPANEVVSRPQVEDDGTAR